ncbi:hypothetical protein E4Z66_09785 [Aliishimia ponticola]|uniref:Uncharacterized protein n=1 Tax=Aliishimia ponticola TaxID=2499833 RepID=A0A4S4NCN3_9RHOB|nr:hypothetical protein [Aliishimia ponticola]THH37204.1 hypothetical protein E4Z66_09785 [Aliishimia ponticola]
MLSLIHLASGAKIVLRKPRKSPATCLRKTVFLQKKQALARATRKLGNLIPLRNTPANPAPQHTKKMWEISPDMLKSRQQKRGTDELQPEIR